MVVRDENTGEMRTDYDHGIPIGLYNRKTKETIIYNHLDIRVKTHKLEGDQNQRRVVGFEVYPKSVRLGNQLGRKTLDEMPDQYLNKDGSSQEILFSYTLMTEASDTTWQHRLDHYYKHGKSDVLMKELIYIACFILVQGSIVYFYIKKSVNEDFAQVYAGQNDQVAWHSLISDLMRPPKEA